MRHMNRTSTVEKMMIILILVFLVGGLWETEAISLTGKLGEKITIECSHNNANTNVKYFCKGPCKDEDVLIRSREEGADSQRKYSITDKGNTFYVTIFHLTEEDSGTYFCGIERVGFDTYNEVVLTVIKGANEGPGSLRQSAKLVYIGTGAGVAVLALAVVLLIFFRQRNRNIRASSGVKGKSDSTANSLVSLSAIQHQDNRGDHVETIYSNVTVSSESQSQPDGVFYATVSVNKCTDCSTAPPHSVEVIYSTIVRTTSDESDGCNV